MNVDLMQVDLLVSIQAQLAFAQELMKLRHVAQITPQRVRRIVPLMAEVVGVRGDQIIHGDSLTTTLTQ